MLFPMLLVGILLFLIIALAIITTRWDPPAVKQCSTCNKREIRESQSRCTQCLWGKISGYQCATCSTNFSWKRITLSTVLLALKLYIVIVVSALSSIMVGPLVAFYMIWLLGLLTLARERLKLRKAVCKKCSIWIWFEATTMRINNQYILILSKERF